MYGVGLSVVYYMFSCGVYVVFCMYVCCMHVCPYVLMYVWCVYVTVV